MDSGRERGLADDFDPPRGDGVDCPRLLDPVLLNLEDLPHEFRRRRHHHLDLGASLRDIRTGAPEGARWLTLEFGGLWIS